MSGRMLPFRAALLLALALASLAPLASASAPKSRQAGQADIASLSPALQGVISGALGEKDPHYQVGVEADGYRARNERQALEASLGADGMSIAAGGGQWRMSLSGWARGASTQPAGTLATKASGNRVEVERGGVTEWWVNGPVGLQQGWTVATRPFAGEAGALELVMRQSGTLRARKGGERSLEVADATGRVVLRYGGLTAFDATGRELPARFEVSSDEVRVRVEDAGAVYPVLVDPITQQAYLKASNTEADDGFGWSVAISGDTVVVGARFEASNATGVDGNQADNSNFSAGAAYVFVRSGATWAQQAYLKASNSGAPDLFGHAVAISGDTIVVGAPQESGSATGVNGNQADDSAPGAGAAYVFVRNGVGAWTQQAYLKASNTGAGDRFGWSVAISGNTVVVGAQFEASNATGVGGDQADDSAVLAGAAYVFVRSGTTWTQQAYLKASNTGVSDRFGWSVSISGDTVVVGAIGEGSSATGVNGDQADNNAASAGAAYVFTRSGTTWSQQAYLKASNTGIGDQFGYSVAISGDKVVVSAVGEDSNATGVNGNQADNSAVDAGAAYVFVRSGTTWTQQAYLKASNTEAGDQFGYAVAISGGAIVVGALGEGSSATGVDGNPLDNSASTAGAAYLFTRTGTTWSQQAYLKASNTGGGDRFGASVAISGAKVVVGAIGEDSNATGVNGNQADNGASNSGAAYVYDISFNYTVTLTVGPNGFVTPSTSQVVTFGRTSIFSLFPDSGYTAIVAGTCGGTLDASNNFFTNEIYANCTVEVSFIPTYAITATASPLAGGTVTCTPNPVSQGGTSTCTATTNAGYTFGAFSGDCTGATCVLSNVTAARSVTATFTLDTYAITATASPVAGGTVTCSPNPVSHGGSSTCTATANAGYTFGAFSGDCTGATCVLSSVTSAKSVTATFTLNTYAINATASPVAGGTVTCSPNPVSHGGSSTCTATANAGYTFGAFSGDCTGATCLLSNVTSARSVTATFTPNTTIPRLANISTRMQVLTGADVLIGGFIIGGSQPKTVVVRARGPSLTAAGVTGALANPVLQLFSGPTQIDANDNWQQAANQATVQSSGFAPADPLESAIHTTLNPGAYTAIVTGANLGTGVAIIEVFEVDRPEVPLLNIATRGKVLTGGDVMIGGFIIQGDAPQTVVVRARGPSLTAAGVPGALQDTVLQLFNGPTEIASNDDWQASPDAAVIQSSGFAPSDTRESVIRITLAPGAYTAIVTGKNGTTGVGIIEVFAQ